MRLLLSIAAVVSMTGAATAFECVSGTTGYMIPLDWSVERSSNGWVNLEITIENGFDKDVDSAMGEAYFIGPVPAPSTGFAGLAVMERVADGAASTVVLQSTGIAYLLDAAPDAFDLELCVRHTHFADGSTQSFEHLGTSFQMRSIGKELVDAFQQVSAEMAAGFLIDYTTFVDLDAAPDLVEALPFSGRAIMYVPNAHHVLLWPEHGNQIVSGNWYIDRIDGRNELCLVFETATRPVVCSNLSRDNGLLLASAQGNPFDLVANGDAPFDAGLVLDRAQSLD